MLRGTGAKPMLGGMWTWAMDSGTTVDGGQPQGMLGIQETSDGRILGHSYHETAVEGGLKSIMSITKFEGRTYGDGSFSFRIQTKSAADTVLATTARLTDADTMRGTTQATFVQDGAPVTVSYGWTAHRLPLN